MNRPLWVTYLGPVPSTLIIFFERHPANKASSEPEYHSSSIPCARSLCRYTNISASGRTAAALLGGRESTKECIARSRFHRQVAVESYLPPRGRGFTPDAPFLPRRR